MSGNTSGNTASHQSTDGFAYVPSDIHFDARNTSFVGRDIGSHNISAHAEGDQFFTVNQPDLDTAGDVILWLRTDTTYLVTHDAVFKVRAEGTGDWFFGSPEFERWDKDEGEENTYLECRGMPGAGKTSLASATVEYFRKQASSGILVLFVYFLHDTQGSQTVEKVLASLLSQVVQKRGSVSEGVNGLYSEYKYHQDAFPPAHKIVEILRSEIASFERTYLIVDALDEYCIANNDNSHQLIDELCHLNVKTLVTSRYHVEFPTVALQLEISAHEDDVQALIDECIAKTTRLRKFIAEKPGLRQSIIQKVTANAKGMILVVRLHLDSISGLKTPGDIQDALDRLPTTLDGAYELAVQRILNQSQKESEIAMETLLWLLHEESQSKVLELRHAVSFKTGMIDESRLWQVDDIVAACSALVVVVDNADAEDDEDEEDDLKPEGKQFCQFVHFSLKEFFEKNRERFFPDAQRRITEKCLEYSIAAIAQSERDGVSDLVKHIRSRFPLCKYATTYWGSHAYKAQKNFHKHHLISTLYKHHISPYIADSNETGIRPLVNQMPPHYYAILYLSRYGLLPAITSYWKTDMGSIDDVRDDFGCTSLLLASTYGHQDVVRLLLEQGADQNAQNEHGNTPLNCASGKGHTAVVELLFKKGVDQSILNNNGQTPLHRAAERGHLAVVEVLLGKGADPNARNKYGNTPLVLASGKGYLAVVELLLEKGADQSIPNNNGYRAVHFAAGGHLPVVQLFLDKGSDPNIRNEHGDTPLHRASWGGHLAVAEFLFEKGADPRILNNKGSTPLHYAAEEGHLAFVQLCLDKGADPNARNEDNNTPLNCASAEGHPVVVELLFEKGADQRISNNNGQTPLHRAAERGHSAVIQIILGKDDDLNARNKYGNTPLTLASINGHLTVAELLFEKRADPSISNNKGSTPLHYAAEGGCVELVQLCLDKGSDPNTRNEDSNTPLNCASSGGHLAVVELLFEKGADQKISNNNGQTPLHRAAERGHLPVVQLLLDKNADLNARNKYGNTPLTLASINKHLAVAELLFEKGADSRIPNNKSLTSLHYAAEDGHLAFVQLCLDKGADPNARNEDGNTPLNCASAEGHPAVVELLFEKGADQRISNNNGQTPLHRAAERGHLAVIQVILGKNADLNSRNKYGNTPLTLALFNGHLAVAKLLIEKGADLNVSGNNGGTFLHAAAEEGHLAFVQLCLDKGADLNAQDADGDTALGVAAYCGHRSLVDLFLDSDIDLNISNNIGQTPLHHASAPRHEVRSNTSMVSSLLARGADPNVQDADGSTPLSLAVLKGRLDAASILIQHGAKVDIANNEGKTPLAVAVEKGYLGIAEMIQAAEKNMASMIPALDTDSNSEKIADNILSEGSGDGIEMEGPSEQESFDAGDGMAMGKRAERSEGDEPGHSRNSQEEADHRESTVDTDLPALADQSQPGHQLEPTHGQGKWFSSLSRLLGAFDIPQGADEYYLGNLM